MSVISFRLAPRGADPAFAISRGSRDTTALTPGPTIALLACDCSVHLSDPGKPSDPRTFLRVPPGCAGDTTERLAAHFASRSSFARRGVGPSSRSAYRTRPRACPDPDGVYRVPHTRAATGKGALYTPRTTVLTPTEATTGRAPAASQRPVPAPRHTSHRQGSRLTRQTRVHAMFARPVFPSPVAARMEQAALGLYPGLRTPPTKSRTTHARVGTGHRARTWNYTLNSHQSISNPVVHSL